jgi:hypothetical protein
MMKMDLNIVADMVGTQLKFKLTQEQLEQVPQDCLGYLKMGSNGICYYRAKIENDKFYTIPEFLINLFTNVEEVIPTLVLTEFGNYDPEQNYGIAQIVCGCSGKPILPFVTSDRPGASSAIFGVPHAAVLCRAQRRSDGRWMLNIYDVALEFERVENSLRLKISQYWQGTIFTAAPRRYQTALAFAMAKAVTPYGCGPTYYAPRAKTEVIES